MKILVVGDIHVGNYDLGGIECRWKQFFEWNKIVESVAKENGCEQLFIAGDILRYAVNSNEIVHRTKSWIEDLCSRLEVHYLAGNHDLNNCSLEDGTNQTILTAFEIDNFFYHNREVLDYNGCKIGFQNYMDSPDTSWIENKLDFLITHAAIFDPKNTFFGASQKFDLDCAEKIIFGHIHHEYKYKNAYSIGCPIPGNLGDEQTESAIILDTETKKVSRVKLDPEHKHFLHFIKTHDKESAGLKEGTLDFYIYKPLIPTAENASKSVEVNGQETIDHIIELAVEQQDLQDIHKEIVSSTNFKDEGISFDFKVNSLKIRNIRSIKEMDLYFTGHDRIVLQGETNGVGKTTILNALQSIFERASNLKNLKSFWCKKDDVTSVEVEFDYQDKHYRIYKSDKDCFFEENGKEVLVGSKLDFEKQLNEKLPFLNYKELIFLSAEDNGLNQIDAKKRVELIQKFFGLTKIEELYEASNKIVSDISSKIQEKKNSILVKSGQLQALENSQLELAESIRDSNIEEANKKILFIKEQQEKANKYAEWNSKTSIIIEQGKRAKSNLDESKSRLDGKTSDVLEKEKESLELEISGDTDLLNKEQEKLVEAEKILTELNLKKQEGVKKKSELDNVNRGICPTCGQEIDKKEVEELKSKLNLELESLRESCKLLISKSKVYNLNEINDNISSYNKRLYNNKERLKYLISEISSLKAYKDAVVKFEEEYKKASADYKEHIKNKPERVTEEIEDIYQYQRIIDDINKYNSNISSINKIKEETASVTSEIDDLQKSMDRYVKYSSTMAPTGLVMELICQQLAECFSSNEFKYEVVSGTKRNKEYLEMDVKIQNVPGIYIPFNGMSSGQKVKAGLDFLNCLVSAQPLGLCCMDESMGHLKPEAALEAGEKVDNLNINTIFIIDHVASNEHYTQKINLRLNDKGETVVIE